MRYDSVDRLDSSNDFDSKGSSLVRRTWVDDLSVATRESNGMTLDIHKMKAYFEARTNTKIQGIT